MILKRWTLLVAVLFFALAAKAQEGHDIRIKVPEFKDTTAILAYHLGNSKYIRDTLYFDSEGVIEMKGNDLIERGMYLLVVPGEKYFEFIIADDQHFSMETHAPDFVENMKVEGSLDNDLFYQDMRNIISKRDDYEKFSSRYVKIKDEKPDSAAIKMFDLSGRRLKKNIRKHFMQLFCVRWTNPKFRTFQLIRKPVKRIQVILIDIIRNITLTALISMNRACCALRFFIRSSPLI